MKKLVALLLTVAMMLTMVSFAAAEEPVELIWWMGTNADAPIDQAMVEEQLNAITKDKLGITVKCVYMTNAQIGLAMSAGEYYDMGLPAAGTTISPPTSSPASSWTSRSW